MSANKLLTVLGAFALLSIGACASAGGTAEDGTRRDPDLITAAELASSPSTNLYDAIRMLRPAMLRVRGQSSINLPSPIRVYVNGASRGDVDTLRSIRTGSVSEVRFLDGMSATQRFGTGHTNGAILVTIG